MKTAINKVSEGPGPVQRSLVPGWYLIDGRLPAQEGNLSAWALAEDVGLRAPLPITLKGRLFELVLLPTGAQTLRVSVQAADREVAPLQLSVRRVTSLQALFLMWNRNLGALPGMPPNQRKALGLGWLSTVLRPKRSYQLFSKLRAHFPASSYPEWIRNYESVTPAQRQKLRARLQRRDVSGFSVRVLIDLRQAKHLPDVHSALETVRQQWDVQPRIQLLVADPTPADIRHELEILGLETITESALGRETVTAGSWTLYTPATTSLAPWALAYVTCEVLRHPAAALIYSDHDSLSPDGERENPKFKPDFSLELARSSAYLGSVLAIRDDRFREVVARGGLESGYELMLECIRLCGPQEIHHVPAILWHQRGDDVVPDKAALERHLSRYGEMAEVLPDRGTHLRLRYPLPNTVPKVSIIVPTRDLLHFLKPCVESVLTRTTWSNYELLVVDNQSSCTETLAYMNAIGRDARVRVLRYDQPFNFSAINNYAVEQAQGDIICLLNNDTEILTPAWLEELVSRVLQPGVGVVGARLYFTDGRVQHAGDVLGPGGCASHLHGFLAGDDPGYMDRALLAQDLSAVTAACLVTPRELYRRLGGLEEKRLPVAFNDVDYCLRARESGYRVIYTPYAELFHHESVSRGKDDDPVKAARARREVAYMRERWADVIERDPFYNPNLNYARADFRLGRLPRTVFPWA